MFGLMTVSAHDAIVGELRARVAKAESDADGWRFLAQKLAADIVEMGKPAVIAGEPGEGSIDDNDREWIVEARKRAES